MNNLSPYVLPNAKPVPFPLPVGRSAILMIDMQRDFVMKGGYGYLQCNSDELFSEVSKIIEPCVKTLSAARKLGMTVIHTREGHKPDLSDCPPSKMYRQYYANSANYPLLIGDKGPMGKLLVRGEYGHDIIDELKPLKAEIVIDKPGKGTFYNTDIHQILVTRGLTHLLICGVTTECCVATTFREANDHGFDCCVLADCTGGFDFNIVKESLNVSCAYDGLLGSLGSGKDLIEIAEQSPKLSLLNSKTEDFGMKVGEIIEKNGRLFEGIKFCITTDLDSSDSSLVKFLLNEGAKLIKEFSENVDFILGVDCGLKTDPQKFSFFMSFSSGMLSLKGDKSPSSLNSISIQSNSIFMLRYAYSNLRFYDSSDPYSKQFYEFPISHIDYRGVALGGYNFSSVDEMFFENFNIVVDTSFIGMKLSKFGGSYIQFNWKALIDVVKLALDGTDKFPIGPVSLELQPYLKNLYKESSTEHLNYLYYQAALNCLLKMKRQLENEMHNIDLLVLPSSLTTVLKGQMHISLPRIVSKIMGWPYIITSSAVYISKFGLDGRLLDIIEHINQCT